MLGNPEPPFMPLNMLLNNILSCCMGVWSCLTGAYKIQPEALGGQQGLGAIYQVTLALGFPTFPLGCLKSILVYGSGTAQGGLGMVTIIKSPY